ncbi:MAG TPA: heavy metal sensor histidine kinase [Candidatus Sulfopaludibacter sp.]|jgi:heavy metal sensor kinase|nr:heavy metal sensor histidine kinase [Candidatus Sulfopaludibacter sp.]
MFKSFRLRLTVWYVAFFSLLFVVFGIFLYGVLSSALQARLQETLSAEANTASLMMADELVEEKGDALKAAGEVVSSLRGNPVAILSEGRVLASTGLFFQRGFESAAARAANRSGAEIALALPDLGSHGSRAVVRRLAQDGRNYLIVAAAPLDFVAADLAAVRRALLFATPLLIALAGLGGYWLTTRGLAPLGWMAAQAREITGSNLHARLEIGDAAEELTALSASFNELLSRLDQSFESMRRFVADASHELRTPISVIRGEADVALSSDRSPAEYRQALALILDESRRLSRLVDDLLNLARADAGNVRLQVQEFYFNDLLAECCRSVQALSSARGIRLECRVGEDVSFHGDEELLRRLVINLLDNAIRYTPEGGTVSASLLAGQRELRVEVSDTGMGISAEAVPHLFERFYRADKARSRQDGGFGLGLAIVKWIAESHRGMVDLASRPGEGSTFTVTLPRG